MPEITRKRFAISSSYASKLPQKERSLTSEPFENMLNGRRSRTTSELRKERFLSVPAMRYHCTARRATAAPEGLRATFRDASDGASDDSETIQEPWPSNLQSATTFDASAEVSTRKIFRKIFFPHIDGRISLV
uniref:Uncharacterized protein n=1 Tax=Vespula pensylvanica TaxID=30213 RepID=A0A834JV30_VESPE|nr:hypothetical protein H0235_016746 [Vespula pensylvanica]